MAQTRGFVKIRLDERNEAHGVICLGKTLKQKKFKNIGVEARVLCIARARHSVILTVNVDLLCSYTRASSAPSDACRIKRGDSACARINTKHAMDRIKAAANRDDRNREW